MVNMNKHRDPAVYALHAGDHQYFYIGSTSINSLNRLWQHRARARSGHQAPVYVKMREIGIDRIEVADIARESDEAMRKDLEVAAIVQMRALGHPLVNQLWVKGEGVPVASKYYRRIQNDSPLAADLRAPKIRKRVERPQKERPKPEHGTRYMYETMKCKCPACRLAGAQRNAMRRGKPIPTVPPTKGSPMRHGEARTYKHGGCRCQECFNALWAQRQAASI